MGKAMLGVDFGADYLKLALVDGLGNLAQAVYERMPVNLMSNGRIVSAQAMGDFIREVMRRNGIKAKDAALALSSSYCYVRRVTVPAMSVQQLTLNLPFEFRDYLRDEQGKYRYDYAVLGTTADESGQPASFDLLAAAVSLSDLEDLAATFKRAGLRMRVATPAIMCFVTALRGFGGGENQAPAEVKDCCLIDVGSSQTRAHLFPAGTYDMTRSMDFGSSSLMKAIASHFDVAEQVAISYYEKNYQGSQSIQECLDLYERAALEFSRIANFFNFNYRDSSLSTVYYTGVAANNPYLMKAVSEALSVELVSAGALLPARLCPSTQEELNLCFAAICVAA